MNNPFLGYGKVITGERFIGRRDELDFLTERIQNFSGSISVTGEHRIGKTSLVNKSINDLKPTITKKKHYFLWKTLSTINNLSSFYEDIFYDVQEIAKGYEDISKDIFNPELFLSELNLYSRYRITKRLFKKLAKLSFRFSIILDEFDSIRLFSDSQIFIQQLRELLDFQDEFGVMCIFISRRSLYHLENQIPDISNLDNICEKLFITPFSSSELHLISERISASWGNINDEIELLWKYSGGHPYISEMILCKGWKKKSIEFGFLESRSEIFSHYKRLEKLLEEDKIFSMMCQLVVGPRWENDTEQMHRLLKYGLVKQIDKTFHAFSDHFQSYLTMVFRQKPLWGTWTKTEILIRDLISSKLTTIYGSNWITQICKKHSGISKLFEKANEIKKREIKLFGNDIELSPLEYTYPKELWEIIKNEWPHFQTIFRRDKRYWQERFDFLASIRNPLAHSREHIFSEERIHLANGYCIEIINLITSARPKTGEFEASVS